MRNDGYLIFDGCWLERALRWSYSTLPGHESIPALMNTEYHALAELGPIMIRAAVGDKADQVWRSRESPIQHAIWLETSLDPDAMLHFMQARLVVSSQGGQDFWLRLVDSRPLGRAFDFQALWPDDFWNGIDAVWLQGSDGIYKAWSSAAEHPAKTSTPPKNAASRNLPSFVLNNETLHRLALTATEGSL